jgi:tripartite-type tricarboxylate transporter receptor subunit TctC
MNCMERLAWAAAAASVITASAAFGQTYPVKPIRVIMTVGSGADLVARVVAQRMSETLGQPVLVEIQSGAGGAVGADVVARAAPDGHTILLGAAGSQIMHVFLAKTTSYDPVKDFTPISQVASAVTGVMAHPSFPGNSVKEMIDYARRNPGKISYGSSGVGTTGHLSAELLKMLTGINMVHIPYKSGSQSVTDLIGGQIPISIISLSPVIPHLKTGKVKILGMNTSKRFRVLPVIPTVGEQVPGYEPPPAWMGYFGPAGLPQPIVRRLNEEIVKAVNSEEVRAKFEAIGFMVLTSTPEEFAATIRSNLETMAKVVKAAGIQPE